VTFAFVQASRRILLVREQILPSCTDTVLLFFFPPCLGSNVVHLRHSFWDHSVTDQVRMQSHPRPHLWFDHLFAVRLGTCPLRSGVRAGNQCLTSRCLDLPWYVMSARWFARCLFLDFVLRHRELQRLCGHCECPSRRPVLWSASIARTLPRPGLSGVSHHYHFFDFGAGILPFAFGYIA